jgi:hypothetical protein
MKPTRLALPALLTLLLLLAHGTAAAQPRDRNAPPTSGNDRMYLSFIEDAAVVGNQWWEVRGEIVEDDDIDARLLRGVVAFQPWRRVELGGTAAFGSTDADPPAPDGSGATDLDVWGKYHLGQTDDKLEVAAGAVLTVPTGDDSEGLGFDAFSLGGFGAIRYRLPEVILAGHAGVRFNEDPEIGGVEGDGETSPMAGVGVIYPHTDRFSIVGEIDIEAERFEGGDTNAQVLGGINWSPTARGVVRAAIAFGLDDGAPDTTVTGGWAWRF